MSENLLKLYTVGTPNGHKISIFLQELKAVYPAIDYEWQALDIMRNETKEPWFVKLNPNERVPVLVDHARDDFVVIESAAILLYLQQHYDKDNKFGFPSKSNEESEMLQWIFFAHGGVNVMQSQLNHFLHFAREDIPYAKKRYLDETKRLYNVLNIRLADRDWLVGDKISIAEFNVWPLIRIHKFSGIENLDEWPNVKAWAERIAARPAVKEGLTIPLPLGV